MTLTETNQSTERTDPWPGLYDVPAGPRAKVSAVVAKRIFDHAARRLDIVVSTPESPHEELERPTIVLHRPAEFFRRVGADGLIGFGEAYLTGSWDSPDLGKLLTTMASEIATMVPQPLQKMRAFYVAKAPRVHKNTVDQTRGNIAHHYDLSNDLFATFLDSTLSYSSALYPTAIERNGDHLQAVAPVGVTAQDLAGAQVAKMERMLDQAGVGAGTRMLEIGTGWGELAIMAARRGATVRSVTLSSEQQALARARIAEAGFTDSIDVDLLDYRQVTGSYDAICSVEMIEAVGHEYWPTYFAKIDSLLAPGGRVTIQAITMPHDRMLATRNGFTWINKYVFPGGFLPSVQAIEEVTTEHTDLRVSERLSFGTHYAETLRLWDEAFLAAGPTVRDLGFDDIFERMWHFYLEYSRAGFASGYLDVQQLTLTRNGS